MHVAILGPLQVISASGQVIEIGGARLRALLVRLALDAGHVVSGAALSRTLWPEDEPANRANALQSLVSRLRRALGDPSVLRSAASGYRLDLPPDAIDALRFERLVRAGREAQRRSDARSARALLDEALDLWRGDALADTADDPAAQAVVARLEELRLVATEDRVDVRLAAAGERSGVIAELNELIAAHPLRERPRALLVRALHADGRSAEALAAYEEYRRRIADELGADPGVELRELHLAVLRDAAADPVGEPARRRGNLRAQLNSFVGRSGEMAAIGRQLTDGRLVTLIGPGGAGKTRLATTFAASVADRFAGGVWVVELATVIDPSDVAAAVAGTLDVRGAELLDSLRMVEALIVLDNCEHVVDAVAQLAVDLLGHCPLLRILATSSEPLGVPGEVLRPVPPLPVPPPGGGTGDLLTYASVQLFVDRVAAVRPDFGVTGENAGAVVEICRRLDGLPLAIELAAARLRSLPVEKLAARLDDRFRLLTGGSRTVLPRHRTLRAVVDWSWRLLDIDERTLAERLAVFPGDVTVEAAEAVCAGGPVAADAVLDLLSALVDKSLLRLVDGAEPRYRMLETIREYGMERLAANREIARVRAAHIACYLDLAERAEPHLRGPDQARWFALLEVERPNLLAALRVAMDTADADRAVRLAAALGPLWMIQGNHAEAAGLLRLALEVPGDARAGVRTAATAWYLFHAVLSAGQATADVDVDSLLPRLRPAGEDDHPRRALVDAAIALLRDDTEAGLAAVDHGLSTSDPWDRGMLWLMRAFLSGNHTDMAGARRALEAAVHEFRVAGDRWGLALALAGLAEADTILGDLDAAIAGLEEAVRATLELDPAGEAVPQRVWLAAARAQKGDIDGARRELTALTRTVTSSGRDLVLARITLGHLARFEGDLDASAAHYAAAEDDLRRLAFPVPLFRAILGIAMGHLAVAQGEPAAARARLDEAFRLAVDAPDIPVAAAVGVAVARLLVADADSAAEVLGAAHALRGGPDASNIDVVAVSQHLRTVLGDHRYTTAYERGRGLARDRALALVASRLGE